MKWLTQVRLTRHVVKDWITLFRTDGCSVPFISWIWIACGEKKGFFLWAGTVSSGVFWFYSQMSNWSTAPFSCVYIFSIPQTAITGTWANYYIIVNTISFCHHGVWMEQIEHFADSRTNCLSICPPLVSGAIDYRAYTAYSRVLFPFHPASPGGSPVTEQNVNTAQRVYLTTCCLAQWPSQWWRLKKKGELARNQ